MKTYGFQKWCNDHKTFVASYPPPITISPVSKTDATITITNQYLLHPGNMLLMCQSNGLVYAIREQNLTLSLLHEHSIELVGSSYNIFKEDSLFTFLHVDFFGGVYVYFTVERELFVLDFNNRRLVGKYKNEYSLYVADVKSNWSGEEVIIMIISFQLHQSLSDISFLYRFGKPRSSVRLSGAVCSQR